MGKLKGAYIGLGIAIETGVGAGLGTVFDPTIAAIQGIGLGFFTGLIIAIFLEGAAEKKAEENGLIC